MVARTRPATLDDLDATPDDGRIYELLNGEIVVSPAPHPRHQFTVQALNAILEPWLTERGIGDLYPSPFDLVLSDGNAVQPDLFVVLDENPADFHDERFHGAPDIAIEVISPGSRSRDATEKATRYAKEGVLEYWLVDPEFRTITIFSLLGDVYRRRDQTSERALTSGVLSGLTLDPVAVFERVDQKFARRRARR